MKSFDNDISKCIYNQGKLYVKDWLKLIYKVDYIIPMSFLTCSVYYDVHKRFSLDEGREDKSIEDFKKLSLDKMEERIKKYKNRNIILIPVNNIVERIHKLNKLLEDEKYYLEYCNCPLLNGICCSVHKKKIPEQIKWNLLLKDVSFNNSIEIYNYLGIVKNILNILNL